MNRLTLSLSAHLKKIQISRAAIYVFVEGKLVDRYVYSKIVKSECGKHKVSYQTIAAQEISEECGGKDVLLKFHDYLESRRSLISDFKGAKTGCIFYLDKDIDDLKRVQRRSRHIAYTDTYCIENYLYMYGRLNEAVALSGSFDIAETAHLENNEKWTYEAASKLKEWVKICLFSILHAVPNIRNYNLLRSPINNAQNESLDQDKHRECLDEMYDKSGMSRDNFDKEFHIVSRKVDEMYDKKMHDKIFKGRWYRVILVNALRDIRKISGGANFIEASLVAALTASMDFEHEWTNIFRKYLKDIITEIKSG